MIDIFESARKAIDRGLIERYIPGGKWTSKGYETLNPLRNDSHTGSFYISEDGLYNDFASGQCGDFIDLVSKLKMISLKESADLIVGSIDSKKDFIQPADKITKKTEDKIAITPIPESMKNNLSKMIGNDFWKKTFGSPKKIYTYKNIENEIIIFVCRFEKESTKENGKHHKEILPFYLSKDGFKTGIPTNVNVPLYGEHLLADKNYNKKILIVEGEKCALVKLDDYILISWQGGIKNITHQQWNALKNYKSITIWPDADNDGLKGAFDIKKKLPQSEILKIKDKKKGWDIADAADEGIDLIEFVNKCDRYESVITLASIDASNSAQLNEIVDQAWGAIFSINFPERLFMFASKPSRIIYDNDKNIIERLDRFSLQLESAVSAKWFVAKRDEMYPTRPPIAIINSMLAVDPVKIKLPRLNRIVSAPVFNSEGKLNIEAGYHSDNQTYFSPGNLKLKSIKKNPSVEDVKKSIECITAPLVDFPFVSESDKAHVIAAMITPFVRDMVDRVPGFLIESPEPGTGKGLLSKIIFTPATGGNVDIFSPARNDDEQRKRITSALSLSPTYLYLDNCIDLSGQQYATLLTADAWSDRLLSKNEVVSYPVRCVFVASGNNVTLTTEIARRLLRARIEANQDRPWLRENFKIKNLSKWLIENRNEMVESCLTIIQSWISCGMKSGSCKPLGSFERFSEVLGGILENAGIEGFMQNIIDMYEQSDNEGAAIRSLMTEWYKLYGSEEMKAVDIFPITKEIYGLPIHGKSEESLKRSFARFLSTQRQRIFTLSVDGVDKSLKLVPSRVVHKIAYWRLVDINIQNNLFGEKEDGEIEEIPF